MTTQETANDQVSAEELATVLDDHAATLSLLSQLYRTEPGEEGIAILRAMRWPAATGNAALDAGYRAMATWLANAWENSAEELAVDFSRTFIGNGVDAYSAAFPFESVYTSEKRLLMQGARDEVLAIYRSEGLDKDADWKESEDHLTCETELLSVLLTRAAAALRTGDEAEAVRGLTVARNFASEHFACWVPMLTMDMRRFARTGFYRGLADVTDGFAEVLEEFLGELVTDGKSDEGEE